MFDFEPLSTSVLQARARACVCVRARACSCVYHVAQRPGRDLIVLPGHVACPSCGTYRGRKVLKVAEIA